MRAQSEIERRVLDLIEPEAKALGLELVRVRVSGARTPVLQIMAERPDGTMDVADCAKLSRRLSPLMDEHDPISGEYTLEVSSPGIDRPLTRVGDFARWVGHEARVEIGMPVDGRKRFHGFIETERDGVVELRLKEGGAAMIAIAEMTKASLVLTDALIAAASARGQVPQTLDDDVEEDIEDDADSAPGEDELDDEDLDDGDLDDAGYVDDDDEDDDDESLKDRE